MTFLLVLAALASAQTDFQACPPGWVRVPTRDRNEPFHCRRDMDPSTPFIEMTPNFKIPHCPQGFSPVRTPGELERYRCVMDSPKKTAEPDLSPVLVDKAPPKVDKGGGPPPAVLEYLQYTMRDVLQFDYPKSWHLTDAWSDEVPTLYIEYDTGRQGKQPTLVITKYANGQEGWVDMETAIAQEKEFQNAKELAATKVGGLPARVTVVAKETRSVYVNAGKEAYYVISYTAPEDLFPSYEPAFRRLTDTFRLSRRLLDAR